MTCVGGATKGIGSRDVGKRELLTSHITHATLAYTMVLDKKLIDTIVQRVLSVAQPERLIVFGSAATGQMNRDSDIDLLVIEPSPSDTRQETLRVRKALRGLGYPFDVIVIPSERFEETKSVIGGIAYPANKYGKVIYEAA